MFWNKDKKEQIGGIQTQLQSEDNNFHRTIIALERLERFLNSERGLNNSELKSTAIGTSRDFHDDAKNTPTRESYFMELSIQCSTLYIAAHYDDKEVFETAVEAFMKDLLEWYAGRELLDYYDEVDACVIPIMVALTYQSNNIDEIFQKYVYAIPTVEQSHEEKYQAIKTGVESWLLGKHLAEESLKQPQSLSNQEGYITSHIRGNAVDGYKRVISALTTMFDTSAPSKMLYKMVDKYLPYIVQQFPSVNEETIDDLYEKKAKGFVPITTENDVEESSALSKIYPLLYNAVISILDEHSVKYSEINIEVKQS